MHTLSLSLSLRVMSETLASSPCARYFHLFLPRPPKLTFLLKPIYQYQFLNQKTKQLNKACSTLSSQD
jgi:hypothetical protein